MHFLSFPLIPYHVKTSLIFAFIKTLLRCVPGTGKNKLACLLFYTAVFPKEKFNTTDWRGEKNQRKEGRLKAI